MPFVSVIVPVYNAEKYVEKCMRSIINQSFKDIEIILVNDGSSDGSLDIAMQYAERDARVKVFSQRNQGVSAARNLGIEKATGQHICFVDADDYIDSTMIEKLVQVSSADVLGVCNFAHNDSEEKILCHMPASNYIKTGTDLYEDYLAGPLGTQIAFSACNKLFSMRTISNYKIEFPTGITIGEDMLFVLRYLCHTKQLRCVDEALYHYSIRLDSTMNAVSRDYLKDYSITLQALHEFKEKELKIEKSTLAAWSMRTLPTILTNQYVEEMNYVDFKSYNSLFSKSLMAQLISQYGRIGNMKQAALYVAIKTKSAWLLFCIIKLNRWRLNLHKNTGD